jgi:hypothetical protein
VQLLYNSLNDGEIFRKHSTPPKLNFLKVETNPRMDMKQTLILVKSLNVFSWKLFHELQL